MFSSKKEDEREREYSSFDIEEYFQIRLSQPFRGTKFQFRYINQVRIQLEKRSFKN